MGKAVAGSPWIPAVVRFLMNSSCHHRRRGLALERATPWSVPFIERKKAIGVEG
jgi:hypothetical protein